MVKSFWKTYLVDIVMLTLLGIFGVLAKEFVSNFFSLVEAYQTEIQVLEPELAEQSVTALVTLETMLADLNTLVWFTTFFILVLVPFIVYLLFSFSQALDVAFLKGKVKWKFLLGSLGLGLPFLLVFIFFLDHIGQELGMMLMSWSSFGWSITYLIFIFLAMYVWYTMVCLYSRKKLKSKWKILYKKSYRLLPVFLLFVISFIVPVLVVVYLGLRYVTESFYGYGWVWLVGLFLLFLALVQVLRVVYVRQVAKCS